MSIYNSPHSYTGSLGSFMQLFVRTASRRTRTAMARLLAVVLLSAIVHAVTFGSAHSHVSAGSSLGAGRSAASLSQSAWAEPELFHYRTDRQECLICLFHQQLFNSVVHAPFYVPEQNSPATGSLGKKLLKYSAVFASVPLARMSGRAPPRH